MALAHPSIPDNVVQAINGFINEMSHACLLTWTVDGKFPTGSFGGLTNTTGIYVLARQVLMSLRALTWGVWPGSWPPAANNSPLSRGVRPRSMISWSQHCGRLNLSRAFWLLSCTGYSAGHISSELART
jgi:hypothetical protein